MALPVYGSTGTALSGSSSTSANVPVPSGVDVDHIILVFMYIETTQSVTPPAGFTEAPDSAVVVTGSHAHNMRVYWKRATAADSGTYNFTIAAGLAWRFAVALRFTGCITSGNPFDVTASAIKTTTTTATTPAVSDTTTGADRLWVWSASFFNGDVTMTPPSGFTERADVSSGVALAVACKDQATAGASGSLTGTWSGNGASGAWLGALLPVGDAPAVSGGFFGLM